MWTGRNHFGGTFPTAALFAHTRNPGTARGSRTKQQAAFSTPDRESTWHAYRLAPHPPAPHVMRNATPENTKTAAACWATSKAQCQPRRGATDIYGPDAPGVVQLALLNVNTVLERVWYELEACRNRCVYMFGMFGSVTHLEAGGSQAGCSHGGWCRHTYKERNRFMYIYIYIERERERDTCVCIYIYVYIYIYIYRL